MAGIATAVVIDETATADVSRNASHAGDIDTDVLGHTLHHQGLALDEELIHDEHQKDIEREALGASETVPPAEEGEDARSRE